MDLIKIKDIKTLKSQNITTSLKEEAKKIRFTKITKRIFYKYDTNCLEYLSIFLLRWKREIFYSKYKKAAKLILTLLRKNHSENILHLRALSNHNKLYHKYIAHLNKRYLDNTIQILNILYHREKCIKLEQHFLRKEFFCFIMKMKYIHELSYHLRKFVHKKDIDRLYIIKRYFHEWFSFVKIHKSFILKLRTQEVSLFLKNIGDSQYKFVTNRFKENSFKLLKIYKLIDNTYNKKTLKMLLKRWVIIVHREKHLINATNKLTKIVEFLTKKHHFVSINYNIYMLKVLHSLNRFKKNS